VGTVLFPNFIAVLVTEEINLVFFVTTVAKETLNNKIHVKVVIIVHDENPQK